MENLKEKVKKMIEKIKIFFQNLFKREQGENSEEIRKSKVEIKSLKRKNQEKIKQLKIEEKEEIKLIKEREKENAKIFLLQKQLDETEDIRKQAKLQKKIQKVTEKQILKEKRLEIKQAKMLKRQKDRENRKLIKEYKKSNEEYIIKKNTLIRLAKVFLWVMLSFTFMRGVVSAFKVDDSKKDLNIIIDEFKAEYANLIDNAELMAFAENFTKEYLTYNSKDNFEQNERIKQYISDRNMSTGIEGGNSKALYASAYRYEQYSEFQADVYVKFEAESTVKKLVEDKMTDVTISNAGILKVPIYFKDNEFLVEDTPVFVNDNNLLKDYESKKVEYETISDEALKNKIKDSLASFYTAYYSGNQTEINYYLDKDANANNFLGLQGTYEFVKIENLEIYQYKKDEDILCLVSLNIKNPSVESTFLQKYNLVINIAEDKVYIKSMDTKNINIK